MAEEPWTGSCVQEFPMYRVSFIYGPGRTIYTFLFQETAHQITAQTSNSSFCDRTAGNKKRETLVVWKCEASLF